MSLFNVYVRAGKNGAHKEVRVTVLAKSRGNAIRIAQDNVRTALGLGPNASVLGRVA